MKTHKVRKHTWKDGVLNTTDHIFYSIESALHFCNDKRNHTGVDVIKVITPEGDVAHSVELTAVDTTNNYA
jgi:hypothetical protein